MPLGEEGDARDAGRGERTIARAGQDVAWHMHASRLVWKSLACRWVRREVHWVQGGER
jgi:hypothetical protein